MLHRKLVKQSSRRIIPYAAIKQAINHALVHIDASVPFQMSSEVVTAIHQYAEDTGDRIIREALESTIVFGYKRIPPEMLALAYCRQNKEACMRDVYESKKTPALNAGMRG